MKKYIKNFFLCLKYPFLKVRNVWTGKFCGYNGTYLDWIPHGWKKAFGKQLCKDLRKALIKDKNLYKFRFSDIKEKYGVPPKQYQKQTFHDRFQENPSYAWSSLCHDRSDFLLVNEYPSVLPSA